MSIGLCKEKLNILVKNDKDSNESKRYHAEAEKNYKEAEVIGQHLRQMYLLSQTFIALGDLYLNTNRIKIAKIALDSAFLAYQCIASKDGIGKTYLGYSIYDSATGNYKKAYEDYKLYMQYFKEAQSDSAIQKTDQLQAKYDIDKKEAIAKAAQDKKDAEAKRIKNRQYFAIAALGIVVLAVVIIAIIQFRSKRHKQQANLALQQQKEKIESTLSELKSTKCQLIQSEKMASLGELTAGIAHEIQNPLNFVNNFSEVNKELAEELKSELLADNKEEAISIADIL